jgi:hypothetical protein
MHPNLKAAFDRELSQAAECEGRGALSASWSHLERAHVLSQPFVRAHVLVHVRMFGFAWRQRAWGELLGQVPRILLAGPASALGRAPSGNTGGTSVGLFQPLPVPEDLRALLDGGA